MKDATPASYDLDCVLLSDIGMKRKQNQDSGLARKDLNLFMVADGMGGHLGGETASKMCVEKVTEYLELHQASGDEGKRLEQALQAANYSIYERSEKEPKLRGMGTTATILYISDYLAYIAQVGDSRCYFWNREGIWQITRDHSLVQEKLRAGLITREEVKTDEMKNVITRSVGYEASVKLDLYQFPIQKGDGFLICSDGLSGPVDDALMFEILEDSNRSGVSLSDTALKLVKSANERGGDDNTTVVIVKIN
jgi:serine/threonine protein phosphatase PrpC